MIATRMKGVSSMDVDSARNIEAETASGERSKPLRLKCDPVKLPKIPYEKPRILSPEELSPEVKSGVQDFFRERYHKIMKQWRKNK